MICKSEVKFKFIPVWPKNYRSICLHAIGSFSDPKVIMDKELVTNFSDQGKLTQKGICACTNFEIRGDNIGILGFHDHPDEMWVNEKYQDFATYCERRGWLRIEGPAS